MGDVTPNYGFYLPGGGSTGTHGADETADIDKINANMQLVDTALKALADALAPLGIPIAIDKGGTGATTAAAARTALGATTIGSTVFTAADANAILTALGVTALGKLLMQAADVDAARAALDIYIQNTEPGDTADKVIWGSWT